jgi:hypothetical protein
MFPIIAVVIDIYRGVVLRRKIIGDIALPSWQDAQPEFMSQGVGKLYFNNIELNVLL